MDTKWKNMNSPGKRRMAAVILFVSTFLFITAIGCIFAFNISYRTIFENDPLQSSSLRNDANTAYALLYELISDYKSENYVLREKIVDSTYVYEKSKQIANGILSNAGYYYNEMEGRIYTNDGSENSPNTFRVMVEGEPLVIVQEQSETYMDNDNTTDSNPSAGSSISSIQEIDDSQMIMVRPDGTKYCDADYFMNGLFFEPAADRIRAEDLSHMRSILNRLSQMKGLKYYVSDERNEYKNTTKSDERNNFTSLPIYYVTNLYSTDTNIEGFYPNSIVSDINLNNVFNIVVGFDFDYYNSLYYEWSFLKILSTVLYSILLFSAAALLIILVYIIYITGKPYYVDQGNGERKIEYSKKKGAVFSDISLFLMITAFTLAVLFTSITVRSGYYPIKSITELFSPIFIISSALFALLASAVITPLIFSFVNDIKNKTVIKHSVIYIVSMKIVRLIKKLIHKISFGFYIVSGQKLREISDGIDRIIVGNFSQPVEIAGEGRISTIADGINKISIGFNVAVENKMRSERMKTELISNVSHDIRTPLTSIITYVDLLKKNNCTEDDKKKYIEIIDQKTARLKTLTDDLFEASKATSGDMAVSLERTDINNVIQQAAGELEDKIESSGLDFRISYSPDKVFAITDGKLLWRVVNNLFSNIFKYSMLGSRVYIDVFNDENAVYITFKNMSAYELNVSAQELTERFTRGDQSRNSEGSGLGLNIARSLVQIMNGVFWLDLDGDLFKVTISFARVI